MQACVKIIQLPASTGTQTYTGVIDRLGNPFTPKAVFFLNGAAALDSLQYGTGSNVTASRWNLGFDDLTNRISSGTADTWSGLGSQIVSDVCDANNYSLIDERPQLFFGGAIWVLAYVSAVASGQFTMQFDTNLRGSQYVIALILGGSDLSVKAGYGSGSGANTVGFAPATILFADGNNIAPTTANGSGTFVLGWDNVNGNRGSGAASNGDGFASNDRNQSNALCMVSPSANTGNTVSSWTSTGFTLNPFNAAAMFLALGGGACITGTAGSFIQPNTPQQQTINVGFTIRAIILQGSDTTTAAGFQTTWLARSAGFYDGNTQASFWTAESTDTPTSSNVTGGHYLGSVDVLRFSGSPTGGTTTFTAVASMVGLSNNSQAFTLNWTKTDSSGREILWWALGESVTGGCSPTPLTPSNPVIVTLPSSGFPLNNTGPQWQLHRFDARPRKEEDS